LIDQSCIFGEEILKGNNGLIINIRKL